MAEFTTPEWLDVPVGDGFVRFTITADGCYRDPQGRELVLDPVMSDGTLTPDAYYELPEED